MKITCSIIAPIYNKKENIPTLWRRVSEVMDSMHEPWELILVDDGNIISRIHKGFKDLYQLGWLPRVPRIIGVVRCEDPVLLLNTGSGLKDICAAMRVVESTPIIGPILEAVRHLL